MFETIKNFLHNVKFLAPVFGSIVPILIYIIVRKNRRRELINQYSNHFIEKINDRKLKFYHYIRERDKQRIETLRKKNRINFIGRDDEDNNCFAIEYANSTYGKKIAGFDCKDITDSSFFEALLNNLKLFFKYNEPIRDITKTVLNQLNKLEPGEGRKYQNIKSSIDMISKACKQYNYVVLLLNVDKINKKYFDSFFRLFLKEMPYLFLTSNTSIVKNDEFFTRFWLSGLDYFSFCTFINFKYFHIQNDINSSLYYLREKIKYLSYQDFINNNILVDSNYRFYIDTFKVIGNETRYFSKIDTILNNDGRDKSIPICERPHLYKDIYSNFDKEFAKLNNLSKSLILLLYDFDISLFDKDLDGFFARYGKDIDYFDYKYYLLNRGIISEMHPQNYCNFWWEKMLLSKINPEQCRSLFLNYHDSEINGTQLDGLPFNIDTLSELSRHQRSFTHGGIYLTPLFRSYLEHRKYDFSSIHDLSVIFVKYLEKSIGKYDRNISKRIIINCFKTILTKKNVPLSAHFDIYMKKIEKIANSDCEFMYYSYLLNKEFRFKAKYRSILGNEAAVFFRPDLLLVDTFGEDIGYNIELL